MVLYVFQKQVPRSFFDYICLDGSFCMQDSTKWHLSGGQCAFDPRSDMPQKRSTEGQTEPESLGLHRHRRHLNQG